MRLVLMRHADAEDSDPRRWRDDRDRPPADAGRREPARVAEALQCIGLRFDCILTSPLRRARQTADVTAGVLDEAPARPSRPIGSGPGPRWRRSSSGSRVSARRASCAWATSRRCRG